MRAFIVPAAGEEPQLSDIPVPEVAADQVLIQVKAAGLNALDSIVASGLMAAMLPYEYPVVIGRDAAGIVEAVGSGVDHVQVGDEVLGHVLLAPPIHHGTIAEYALLPAAAVVTMPPGLDFVTAAAIPLAGAAAAAAIEAIDPQPGETVLVDGATGGVGSYAVQLLAALGIAVVATGTSNDVERLTSMGARVVVDYTRGSIADQVKSIFPDGVDALIELVAAKPEDAPFAALRKGGRVATTTPAADDQTLAAHGLTGGSVRAWPVREVIGPIAEMAATGHIKVDVTTVLPLDWAIEGLATIAAGDARGKIVLKIAN